MFEPTVNNGSKKLWFQQKISESRGVDRDVASLDAFLCVPSVSTVSLLLLASVVFIVVQEFSFVSAIF